MKTIKILKKEEDEDEEEIPNKKFWLTEIIVWNEKEDVICVSCSHNVPTLQAFAAQQIYLSLPKTHLDVIAFSWIDLGWQYEKCMDCEAFWTECFLMDFADSEAVEQLPLPKLLKNYLHYEMIDTIYFENEKEKGEKTLSNAIQYWKTNFDPNIHSERHHTKCIYQNQLEKDTERSSIINELNQKVCYKYCYCDNHKEGCKLDCKCPKTEQYGYYI